MNRKAILVGILLLVAVLAACGGGTSNNQTSSTSSGTPSDAVRAYFTAAFASDGDPTTFLCNASKEAAQALLNGLNQMKASMAASGGSIDVGGLTFTTQNESGDSAEVVVAGKIKVDIGGTAQETDFPPSTIKMKNENGWKLCG